MWSLAASLLTWILGLFGFGKPDPIKQGESLGLAEQQRADAQGELHDIAKADAARSSVADTPADILSDPNNRGPAKP